VPAHAQQNAPVDPETSVVNEQTLLQQFRRIQGDIDQPNQRERVSSSPTAGYGTTSMR